jgi:hypothetical protein
MDQVSFLDSLIGYVNDIDVGRKGLIVFGKEEKSHITYDSGIKKALIAFQDAQKTADCEILALSELSYLTVELNLCAPDDKDARASLTKGIQDFEDAVRCLETVKDKASYEAVEKSYPTYYKFRVQGYPKDAYHIACQGHDTRIHNSLRSTGVLSIEKDLLKQRLSNLETAQEAYIKLQEAALTSRPS